VRNGRTFSIGALLRGWLFEIIALALLIYKGVIKVDRREYLLNVKRFRDINKRLLIFLLMRLVSSVTHL
jgi:hypothetical protein